MRKIIILLTASLTIRFLISTTVFGQQKPTLPEQATEKAKKKWEVKHELTKGSRLPEQGVIMPTKLYFYTKEGRIKKEINLYHSKRKIGEKDIVKFSKTKDKVGIIKLKPEIYKKYIEPAEEKALQKGSSLPSKSHELELYDENGNLLLKTDEVFEYGFTDIIRISPGKRKLVSVLYSIPGGSFGPQYIYDLDKKTKKVIDWTIGVFSENGEYMVCGGIKNNSGKIAKMDLDGNIIWEYKYDYKNRGIGWTTISSNGKYVAGFLDNPGGKLGGDVMVIDSSGNASNYKVDIGGPCNFRFSEDEGYLLFSKRNKVILFQLSPFKIEFEYEIPKPEKGFFLIVNLRCEMNGQKNTVRYGYGSDDSFNWARNGSLPREILIINKSGKITNKIIETEEITFDPVRSGNFFEFYE